MRKVIVLSFITLDGVMQAPGAPDEDLSGGFSYGGWTVPYFDEALGEVMDQQLKPPFELLLGRKTYDLFASYWPNHREEGIEFNKPTKYVVSHQDRNLSWENSVLLNGNAVESIQKLKNTEGPDLQVHGSGELVQTLIKHHLVDELWLKIFPIILGTGKRLFHEGTPPTAFSLKKSSVTPKGVIIADYVLSGQVKTGSF